MSDPYARPTGRIARAVESARYGVGLAIVGGVACVGTVALGVCVVGALNNQRGITRQVSDRWVHLRQR